MPIYEYLCTSCNDLIEVMQKMSDRPLRKCEKCSGRLEKQFSRTAFQLKGDGWFASGYSKSSGNASGSPSAKAAEKSGSSESKAKKDTKAGSDSGSGSKSQVKAASA